MGAAAEPNPRTSRSSGTLADAANAASHVGAAPVTRRNDFEAIYVDAGGDRSRVPWNRGGTAGAPDPALIDWLDRDAPTLLRAGSRVLVPGCGLGDDARELSRRGYETTAFDLSATAIAWAQELDADDAVRYSTGDLFEPPDRWLGRFDLVAECFCVQSMPPSWHEAAVAALANLLGPQGVLVSIGHDGDRPATEIQGPPWPLEAANLREHARAAGLREVAPTARGLVGGRMRAVFVRR
ncbi:MAG: class I SAM-dependent methyltransferase [Phycisphaerales bacterium]